MTDVRQQIDLALDALTPKRRQILELRFGLKDGRSRTLKEIGIEIGVTPERIRQIESTAIRRLRHPIHTQSLKRFLETPEETPEGKLIRAIFGKS